MTNQTRVEVNSTVEHEDVLVANLHTSCISVERTIRLEDLDVQVEHLPSNSRKLLRQPILPEDFTRPYLRIIQRAKAFFERYGSKCEVGTVFDHARGAQLMQFIGELEQELMAQKMKDRARYKDLAANHLEAIAAEPDVKNFPHRDRLLQLLEQRQPLWEDIEDKISLKYTVMLVGSSKAFDADLYSKMQDSIVAIKKGAFGTLIKELCDTARNALDKAVKAETRVHTRTVDAVWAMVDKINELGFLDKRLRVVEKELKRWLAPLVRGEALYDLDYEDFINLMTCFANQHWLVSKLDSNEPIVEVFEESDFESEDLVSEDVKAGEVQSAPQETAAPEAVESKEVEETPQESEETEAPVTASEQVVQPQGGASKPINWF